MVLAALLLPVTAMARASEPADETQVKAAFLYNFARFVDWPPQALGAQDGPIFVGVLGDRVFAEAVERATRGQSVAGRPVVVRQVEPGDDPSGCHILFLSAAVKRRAGEVLQRLEGRPVLTVGESPGFTASGGMINLAKENYRVRLEVNVRAAERANLRISAKLLSLARLVDAPAQGRP